jgi:uncharacterized protein YndB with AHSA1/START domain
MGSLNATVQIPAAPEDVWAKLSDPRSFEQWLTIHTQWKDEPPATFTQGATAAEVVTMLGMPNTITWTVEEVDAPSRLRISGTGMAGVRTTFALGVSGDGNGGSTATIDAEFSGQMITGALGAAVERDAKKQLDDSLAKLSALVG